MNVRHLVVALATLAILPGPSAAREDTLCEQSRLVVEARGLKSVRVENARGRVRVVPSPDGRLHITALKLTSGKSSPQAVELARDTRVETSTTGARYLVRVHYPQSHVVRVSFLRLLKGELSLPSVKVRLIIELPPGLALELESTSGDFETSDLTGPQDLRSTSGDIEVRGAGSPVSLVTTSGDVTASGLGGARVRSVSGGVAVDGARGPLEVRTTSGEIAVRGAADSVRVASVSGDIEVDGAPRGLEAGSTSGSVIVSGRVNGTARVRTTSGNVRLELGAAARRADVNTVSGEIAVRLAAGLACDLTLKSTSGSLDADVPIQIRTMTRRELSGAVSGGGIPVSLRSTSGDITVSGGGK
jgi:hypothetical protein